MPIYTAPRPRALVVPPGMVVTSAAAVWGAVNRAVFARFDLLVPTTVRYVNWSVGVQSGNVQVGLASLSGTGYADYTRLNHTGVIACPAAGDIRTDLTAHVLAPGPYAAFIWADNVTFSTRQTSNSGLTPLRVAGVASSLAAGVPASGTLTYSSVCPSLTIEAA